MSDHFLRRASGAALPFLIWAAHFGFCYIVASAQCTPGGWRPDGPNPYLLGGVTVLALAACAWLGLAAQKRLRAAKRKEFTDHVAAASAVLSFIAIMWTGIPVLLVRGCA